MAFGNIELIVGTYEEYLLGYKLTLSNKTYNFTQNFATHGHSGSIRCLGTCGKYLASGGADDRIIVYDMKQRKEHCVLTHNNSTVNTVEFTVDHTHLISGSTDGVLSITRVGNWQLEKMWDKAHKGNAITSIAVHKSGKLALTLGSDCALRTWNLIKGRLAYAINLNTKSVDPKSLHLIKWHNDGENFILAGGLNLEIWSLTVGGLVKKFNWKSKVASVCYLTDEIVVVGHENGCITILNTETEEQSTIEGHTKRVKCLMAYEDFLFSGSSSGHIKIWRFKKGTLNECGVCNTGCRITCLTLVHDQGIKIEDEIKNEEILSDDEVNNFTNSDKVVKLQSEPRGVVVIEVEGSKKKRYKRKKKQNVHIVEEISSSNKKVKKTNKSPLDVSNWVVENA